MTMEELINKFMELLRFVPYIREDKVKIQQFSDGIQEMYYKWMSSLRHPSDESIRKIR
jgi:hypothetical protein